MVRDELARLIGRLEEHAIASPSEATKRQSNPGAIRSHQPSTILRPLPATNTYSPTTGSHSPTLTITPIFSPTTLPTDPVYTYQTSTPATPAVPDASNSKASKTAIKSPLQLPSLYSFS